MLEERQKKSDLGRRFLLFINKKCYAKSFKMSCCANVQVKEWSRSHDILRAKTTHMDALV